MQMTKIKRERKNANDEGEKKNEMIQMTEKERIQTTKIKKERMQMWKEKERI